MKTDKKRTAEASVEAEDLPVEYRLRPYGIREKGTCTIKRRIVKSEMEGTDYGEYAIIKNRNGGII